MSSAIVSALRTDPAFARLRRSLDVYYGDAPRDAAMDKLYARFVQPGDLAFDIGSHVGDRIGSFRRVGARVVALEPQPLCAQAIRAIYAGDREVTLIESACGATPGKLTLQINSAIPRSRRRPPISSARPTARAAGRGRCGMQPSRSHAQLSMR
jgi:hypothetical protein